MGGKSGGGNSERPKKPKRELTTQEQINKTMGIGRAKAGKKIAIGSAKRTAAGAAPGTRTVSGTGGTKRKPIIVRNARTGKAVARF